MSMRKATTSVEATIMDGTRRLGRVVPAGDQYRARDAVDGDLGKFPSRRDAEHAIFEADRAGGGRT